MKYLFVLIFLALSCLTVSPFSDASPSPEPSAVASSVPAGIAVHVEPPMAPAVVAVAEPAAPPAWAQDVMVSAQALPVIGPIVTKVILYLGIVSALLTSLVAFLLGALATLSKVLSYAGLSKAASAIVAFQNGRFMYYLKFFSQFNAKAPAPAKPEAA